MPLSPADVKVISAERKTWLVFLMAPTGESLEDMDISKATEVENRDVPVTLPPGAVAFQLYDSVQVVFQIGGVEHTYDRNAEDDWDHRVDPTPWRFPNGTMLSRDAVPPEVTLCSADAFEGERWVLAGDGTTYYQFGGPLQHPAETI